ncbi:probable basic-leucine zipper transcription factor O [Topomyia yanbarensis]|uniref:probable basic-leucine zipper transcription factor O n=1 Tax=Topomyia yanbarensis TaxID=2498891 RepID=UPI00273BC9D8|nr:probable basic-leucine zipper transcription factor O [Topomyia yanbarensis]
MSSKLEKVLNISLEDYIAEKGIVSSIRSSPSTSTDVGYFKRQLRSENEDDENDEDMFVEDRNGMDVTSLHSQESLGGDSSIQSGNVEMKIPMIQVDSGSVESVRTFVTEEHKRGIRHMPSQQWRLQRQNQVSKKPAGLPPLMSVKAVFDQNTDRLIASLGDNAKFNNADARNRINQRLTHPRKQNNFHYNNFNNNRRHRNNRNRNQYGRNPNMVPSFNPSVEKIEHRANAQLNINQARDLRSFISPPSSYQSQEVVSGPIGPWNNSNAFGQPQLVTFADMLNRIGQASTVQDRDTFTDVIRNVMRNQQQQQQSALMPTMNAENFSQMTSNELMPFAAQTLLNHISTVHQNFGPKYDMKVQKEIHTLQGKTMFYRSSGVVSTDGAGLPDERVKPVTTDLSMNMRFS